MSVIEKDSLSNNSSMSKEVGGDCAPITLRSILLVEDESQTRKAMKLILRATQMVVIEAETIQIAKGKLSDPSIVWVILDLMLPDGDGADVLAEIRRKKLPCKVVVCSGCGDPVRLAYVKSLQPDAYLQKPVDVTGLLALLRS